MGKVKKVAVQEAKEDKWHRNIPDLSKLSPEDFDPKFLFKRNMAIASAYFSGKMSAVYLGIKHGMSIFRVRQVCYNLLKRSQAGKKKITENKPSTTKKRKKKAQTKK